MMIYISNTVGLIGDAFILVAYFLLQMGRLHAKQLGFCLLNLFGALMIIFSLIFAWNLPAAVIEIAWALISMLGIWRWWRTRRQLI